MEIPKPGAALIFGLLVRQRGNPDRVDDRGEEKSDGLCLKMWRASEEGPANGRPVRDSKQTLFFFVYSICFVVSVSLFFIALLVYFSFTVHSLVKQALTGRRIMPFWTRACLTRAKCFSLLAVTNCALFMFDENNYSVRCVGPLFERGDVSQQKAAC